MFGIPSARIAEMSRPDYARELDAYARLEYPREDPRTVSLLALAATKGPAEPPRRRFRFFRSTQATTEVVSAKA